MPRDLRGRSSRQGHWSRVWPLAALLMLAGAVVLAVLYVLRSRNQEIATKILQTVVALLVACGPVVVALMRRRRPSTPADVTLDQAADALMGHVRRQWQKQAVERRLRHPTPVPVRWELSRLPVGGPVTDAVGAGVGFRRFGVLPGKSAVTANQLQTGSLDELFPVYAGLDGGRIIIVGDAGAGKTGAAIRLLLDAV